MQLIFVSRHGISKSKFVLVHYVSWQTKFSSSSSDKLPFARDQQSHFDFQVCMILKVDIVNQIESTPV